jgi:uncharacterized protein YfiM (DUF2279 family)
MAAPEPTGKACGSCTACWEITGAQAQDWVGNKSIQHTTRYTELSAAPTKYGWFLGRF